MRIALGQIDCRVGDVHANVAAMVRAARGARNAGCELVILPELADAGGDMDAIRRCATHLDRGACSALREAASDIGIWIIAGLSERDGAHVYNTAVAIDPSGRLAARYRKIHLFTADPVHEDQHLAAGDSLTITQIGDWRVGLMLCYDIRFPELARALALRGAELLIVPAAWPFPRLEHWKTLATCRALENQTYLACVNRVGTDGPLTFCGTSRVIDPWAVTIAAASEVDEQLVIGELDKQRIEQARSRIFAFKDRRHQLYRDMLFGDDTRA